ERARARRAPHDRAAGRATAGKGRGKRERRLDMTRNLLYRALIVVAATLAAVVYLIPSVVSSLPGWWKSVLPDQPIRLGLDLRGGMHLVLEVQTEKALEFSVDRSVEDLKRELQNQHVSIGGVTRDGSRSLKIDLGEGGKAEDVAAIMKER